MGYLVLFQFDFPQFNGGSETALRKVGSPLDREGGLFCALPLAGRECEPTSLSHPGDVHSA